MQIDPLHHLDPIDDLLLRLRFQPMTLDQVAELTEVSLRDVRKREARAMRQLRALGETNQTILDHYHKGA